MARLLVQARVSVEERGNRGHTPLHYAAQRGSPKVAQFLLEARASVAVQDIDGQLPVNLATGEEMVALLQCPEVD